MRSRIEMQPLTSALSAASAQVQDSRFYVPLGNAKTAQVFVNVTSFSGASGPATFDFQTATDPSFGAVGFWPKAPTAGGTVTVTANTAGTYTATLSGFADVLRWSLTMTTGTMTFSIVVITADS
jgi:hypothetical protein